MAVPHYVYLLLKMPTKKGVLSLRGNVLIAYSCEKESYATAEALKLLIRMQESIADAMKIPPAELEILSKEATRVAAKSKETKEVDLVPGDKTKTARIEAGLDPKMEDTLISFLRKNISVFVWKPTDMSGVPRELIEHSLDILKTAAKPSSRSYDGSHGTKSRRLG
jgi:hypothetical protein